MSVYQGLGRNVALARLCPDPRNDSYDEVGQECGHRDVVEGHVNGQQHDGLKNIQLDLWGQETQAQRMLQLVSSRSPCWRALVTRKMS